MKKVFNYLLMAAVVLGLSFAVTACSDDDDDNNNGNEQKKDDVNKLDTDEARVAFRWLCVLANAQTLDDNWQSKTYEPTVGQASENDPFTRLIVVSDLEEAKEHFAKLADMETSQLSTTQTVNGGAAGTMTWTPSKEGAQNLGVVEVSSRIMPHLQKIVYCTDEQTGLNGLLWDSMKGVAYYRLGDVVRDTWGYYWVCVRPSFAPDKAESHWINIYNASAKGDVNGRQVPIRPENICNDYDALDKYKKVTIKLPTKLPYDREHIFNLNNFIWALLNPTAYRTETEKVGNGGKGLGGFDYGYHGETFLNLVASFWEEQASGSNYSIWEALFGLTHQQMQTMEELKFYYQGYKWWWGTTADMWRYQSTKYENKISGSESGDKASIEVVANGFDINRYAGDPNADNKAYEAQFLYKNDTYYEGNWVIRYKRGDKLSSTGKYDPYNSIPGCDDIYVFNKKINAPVGKTAAQQTESDLKNSGAQSKAKPGYVLGYDGKYYITKSGAENAGTKAVAMVVYYDANKVVETGTQYHGLAVALTDYPDNKNPQLLDWSTKDSRVSGCSGNTYASAQKYSLLPSVLDGIAVTKRLATHVCNRQHEHIAAEAIYAMQSPVESKANEFSRFSPWFIPSAGQVILACQAMGYQWVNEDGGKFTGNGKWKWEDAGLTDSEIKGFRATCTETTQDAYYTFTQNGFTANPFHTPAIVRPMVAFR